MVAVDPSIELREAFGLALVDLGRRDPRIVVLDADLAVTTKVTYFAQEFPERFFEIGVAEQNMMGIAAGLATLGFIPFTSTFACFAAKRALDQVAVSIAQPRLNVKIVGAYSGLLTAKTGRTHQAIEDIAIYRALPNMAVVAPGDPREVVEAVEAIAAYDGPVYLRCARDPVPCSLPQEYHFSLGKAAVLRIGTDITLISTGSMTSRALLAATELERRGFLASVVHVPTVKPLDVETIVEASAHTKRVITVEEHNILGGLGGAVAEALAEHHPLPLKRIGVRDVFGESGPNEALLQKYGLSIEAIVCAAITFLEGPTN